VTRLICGLFLAGLAFSSAAHSQTLTPTPSSLTFQRNPDGSTWDAPSTCTTPGKTCTQTLTTNLRITSFTPGVANATAANWLTVTQTSPTSLQVQVNVTNLQDGYYAGRIVISANGATNSPVVVPIGLTVYPADGYSASLDSQVVSGSNSITISNFNEAGFAVNASVLALSPVNNSSWITLTQGNPITASGNSANATFTLTPGALNGAAGSAYVAFTDADTGTAGAYVLVTYTPTQVTVPDVVGLTQNAATTALQNAGLVAGVVTNQASGSVPAGAVISQNPPAGTAVAPGTSVSLVVSSGPSSPTVPNVVGVSQAAAAALFQSVGLTVGTVTFQASASIPAGNVISQNPAAGTQVLQGSAVNLVISTGFPTYYFSHLAFGGGYESTLTYVNYGTQNVTCVTTFYSDSGGALQVPFGDGSGSTRTDNLLAGADVHVQTQAGVGAVLTTGWAQGQCTGPVKASLLYRLYSGGVALGEAGVNASTTPATEFVTFAQSQTGVAYANPSPNPATVTITALDSNGNALGSSNFVLQPNAHGAVNVAPFLGLTSFTGSVQITSTVPIVSLSINAENYPVFSSLPPGDLAAGTPLATGTGGGAPSGGPASVYYFPHLAFGGGYESTLTYVNYGTQSVTCETTFYSDSGGALQVPFGGASGSTRTDNLVAGADLHVQTQAGAGAVLTEGWAQGQCTGPIKASLLYRLYSGGVAQGEAGVNASTTPATEFVTFAQSQTGVAYANPSPGAATVTITALDSNGNALGSSNFALQPNAHGAVNVAPLLGLTSFTGSMQITSTVPIVSLSINAENYPVFSSLPPGDLAVATPLAGQ